jgi:uncharacterized protein (DUF2249 family)
MSSDNVRREQVVAALREVIDPEVGLNVFDLGLVYRVEIDLPRVHVQMTMTTPACPLGPYLSAEVERALQRHIPGADDVRVEIVWDPPWNPAFIKDEGRRRLGLRAGPGAANPDFTHPTETNAMQSVRATIDVREIPPRERHPLIFNTFGGLAAGEALLLVNDHDPKPLYYQFQAEHANRFSWEYLEEGPEVWKVRIARVA